ALPLLWVSHGSKTSTLSTSPFTLSTQKAAPYCYTPPLICFTSARVSLQLSANKSGQVWHGRIAAGKRRECRHYGYSASGQNLPGIHSFDCQKYCSIPAGQGVSSRPSSRRRETREQTQKDRPCCTNQRSEVCSSLSH